MSSRATCFECGLKGWITGAAGAANSGWRRACWTGTRTVSWDVSRRGQTMFLQAGLE